MKKIGVYPYPDGRAFKSKMELLKAVPSTRSAKITILDHPDSMVIMSQGQIYGTVENPFFDRDRIRATLNFDKHVTPPKFLADVRAGKLKDVSIGFYYAPDFTPGTWNGQRYDYVMRDIVIDHVAAGVVKGRCSFPSCGIGVDTMMRESASRKIGLDPFGEYSSMQDCIDKNQGKQDNPAAFCAWLHHNITGKWPAEASLRVSTKKGVKKGMTEPLEEEEVLHDLSEQETRYPERSEAFRECVSVRISEGMTRGEAEAHCEAATLPEDEPAPPPGSTGTAQEGKTPTEECIAKKMEAGMSREEAEEACKGEAAGDEEVEKTPMERCVAEQVDAGKSEEEAREWCEAELAGEHEQAGDLIERSEKLLKMKAQRDIERQRQARRHPL